MPIGLFSTDSLGTFRAWCQWLFFRHHEFVTSIAGVNRPPSPERPGLVDTPRWRHYFICPRFSANSSDASACYSGSGLPGRYAPDPVRHPSLTQPPRSSSIKSRQRCALPALSTRSLATSPCGGCLPLREAGRLSWSMSPGATHRPSFHRWPCLVWSGFKSAARGRCGLVLPGPDDPDAGLALSGALQRERQWVLSSATSPTTR